MANKKNVPELTEFEKQALNSPHADLPIMRSEILEELRKVYKDLRDCEIRLCKLVNKEDKSELHCVSYVLRGLRDARSKISDINFVI